MPSVFLTRRVTVIRVVRPFLITVLLLFLVLFAPAVLAVSILLLQAVQLPGRKIQQSNATIRV